MQVVEKEIAKFNDGSSIVERDSKWFYREIPKRPPRTVKKQPGKSSAAGQTLNACIIAAFAVVFPAVAFMGLLYMAVCQSFTGSLKGGAKDEEE